VEADGKKIKKNDNFSHLFVGNCNVMENYVVNMKSLGPMVAGT
jgi:hypothetical protein